MSTVLNGVKVKATISLFSYKKEGEIECNFRVLGILFKSRGFSGLRL